MAQVLRRPGTHEVLAFGETVRAPVPPIEGTAVEERITVASLPAGIAILTTRIADDGTLTVVSQPAVDRVPEIRAASRAHARRVQSYMNPQWLFDGAGAPRLISSGGNPTVTSNRWANAWFWLLSPAVCIEAMLDGQDATWTPDVAQAGLRAYVSLVPNDPERVDFWYRNHNEPVWTGYRQAVSGTGQGETPLAQAHFAYSRGETVIPSFASDAASAASWSGSSSLRLAATIPIGATSLEEALA